MSKTEFIIEPGRQDIVIRRTFDAPADAVYRACTETDSVARWWGAGMFETTVEINEVRHGGRWRYVSHDKDSGETYAFRGIYHDLVPGESITQTFEFEGMPGHVSLETLKLTEKDGQTEYVATSVYQSVEDRDGMAQSDMQDGASASLDIIAEIVEKK